MNKVFAALVVAVGMTLGTAGVAAADPVQPGCVFSGGGWLCGGVLPPDVTPAPEPAPEPVVEAPAEPVEEVPAPVEEVVEPVVEAPAEPIVEAPVAPVVEAPEKVVSPEPTENVVEEPAEPVAPTIITVWPDAPTFIDECGEANDRVVIPANTDEYTYESIEVSAGTQELIDASVWVIPNPGFQFVADDLGGAVPVETAGPYWDHEFTIEPCPVVAPVAPAAPVVTAEPVADDIPAESAEPTAARLAETGSDGGALFGMLLAGLLLLAAGGGTVFAVRAARR